MLNLSQIKHGFSEIGQYADLVKSDYNINKLNVLFDMVKCFFIYGARAQDYWRFEFHKKSRRERNRYMTNMRWLSVVKKLGRIQRNNISTESKISKDSRGIAGGG